MLDGVSERDGCPRQLKGQRTEDSAPTETYCRVVGDTVDGRRGGEKKLLLQN